MTRLATRKPSRPSRPRRSGRSPAASTATTRTARVVAVGVVLAVVVLALAASLVAGGDDDPADTPTGETDAATPNDETGADQALPPFGEGQGGGEGDSGAGADPAVGMALPELRGVDVDGQPMTVQADGRPKLIVFLAHWCPHCQREVPVIQDWVEADGVPDGVDLVAVATAIDERRPNYPADQWLSREGWTPPVLYDHDDTAGDAAGLSAFPFFVATDADGTVVARTSGELSPGQLDALAEQAAGAR